MPSEWRTRLDVLRSEFATIATSVKSIAEHVADPEIDRSALQPALDVAKKRLAQLNEKIVSLDADLN